MKYAFIKQQRQIWPVGVMCRVLEVARSGYYDWLNRKSNAHQQRREALVAPIRQIHQEHRGRYGSIRIHKELIAAGQEVCVNTVAKVMRDEQIRGKNKRSFVPRTTDSDHHQPVAANLLNRDFTADKPNRKWVADITYVPTDEGWLFVAAVLDLFSRRIVGWSMGDRMQADLVNDALTMSLARRKPNTGHQASEADRLLMHSDRGSQYASDDHQLLLEEHGMVCSMSRRGDCYDNAVMESFWATLKTELVHHEHYVTHEDARASIFEYIEVYYNRKRLHSTLGYLSPEAFEASHN